MADTSGRSMEVVLQIFSGGFLSQAVPFDSVEKKLTAILPRLPVRKVIMGWSVDCNAGFSADSAARHTTLLYAKTAELLAKHNVELFLWFPVFSETGSVRALSNLVDLQGLELKSINTNNDENFSFCCPNDPQNIVRILDVYDKEFASIPFTGVFLDKIRFPSFAQGHNAGDGFRNVFSCFCPYCLGKYKEAGFDVDKLKKALSRPVSTPLGITGYKGNGNYVFEDHSVSQFFSLKSGFIYQSLKTMCRYFRERNLCIGFDVFAPFLSAFVGQDLIALSGLCDFVKPMMYRITNAPAGLPFETQMLLKETGCAQNGKQQYFEKLPGVNNPASPFALDFTANELKNLAAVSACPVYAGVEINRKENIANTYPDYIEETMRSYASTGIKGFALSWDILEAPDENIARAAELLGKL